ATPAFRFVNRGGPPSTCVRSGRAANQGFRAEVSSDGETCVVVGTATDASNGQSTFHTITASTSVVDFFLFILATPLPSTPTLAPDDVDGFDTSIPEKSGRLKTVLTGVSYTDISHSFASFGSPIGVRFNGRIASCALTSDSPPLPAGLSLLVESGLRACSILVTESALQATDGVGEYTVVASRGDQSATRKLRLEVIAGNFTAPALSISHGAAGAANTVILNPSTPVAIPFANTGSKLSATLADACQVTTGTLPTGLTVRLATEADQRPGITEGSTCMLVGTPGATAVDAANVTISYPIARAVQNNPNPQTTTVQFSVEVAPTPVLVTLERPIIMEQNRVYTTSDPAATLANTGLSIDSCAIEFVPRTNKFGQAHTALISDDMDALAAEVSGEACVITGTVTGKMSSSSGDDFPAIYRVIATANGADGGVDRTSTAEIKMSYFIPFDEGDLPDFTEDNTLRTVYTDQTFGTRGNSFPGLGFFSFGLRLSGFVFIALNSCGLGVSSPRLPPGISLHVQSNRGGCILYVDPDKSLRMASPPTGYTLVGRSGTQSTFGTLRLEVIEGLFTPPALSIAYPAGSPANTVVIETGSFVTIPFTNTGSKISATHNAALGCRGGFSSPAVTLEDFRLTGLTIRLATKADQDNGIAEEGSTCILSGTPTAAIDPSTAPTAFVEFRNGNIQIASGLNHTRLNFTLSVVDPE
nr:hypothetical protein [Pseudomonadota bacterium]